MKVYAYRAEQLGPRDLPELLGRLYDLPLEQRIFEARTAGMRLESYEPAGDFVYANFAKPRAGHGPGRMSRRRALTEFDMQEDDRFGEDTAFVYHVPSRYVAMQYNHAGPRMESIRDYLFAADLSFGGLRPAARGEPEADRCGYRLGVVLKPDAHERLRRFGIYRSVVIDVSVPGALAADLEQGRSLGSVLNAPLPQGTQRMTVGLYSATDAQAGLGVQRVRQMLADVQRLGHLVHKAVIKGRQTPEDRIEKVDLVTDRLSAELNINVGNGLRLNTQDRWAALRQTLQRWLDNREMPV